MEPEKKPDPIVTRSVKPTKVEYRDAVCDLFEAIKHNPTALAALRLSPRTRKACDALMQLIARDVE